MAFQCEQGLHECLGNTISIRIIRVYSSPHSPVHSFSTVKATTSKSNAYSYYNRRVKSRVSGPRVQYYYTSTEQRISGSKAQTRSFQLAELLYYIYYQRYGYAVSSVRRTPGALHVSSGVPPDCLALSAIAHIKHVKAQYLRSVVVGGILSLNSELLCFCSCRISTHQCYCIHRNCCTELARGVLQYCSSIVYSEASCVTARMRGYYCSSRFCCVGGDSIVLQTGEM